MNEKKPKKKTIILADSAVPDDVAWRQPAEHIVDLLVSLAFSQNGK